MTLSYAEINVRRMLAALRFPEKVTMLNVQTFGVSAWNDAHAQHVTAINNRIRVAKIDLVNAKRGKNDDAEISASAKLDALEMLLVDVQRMS
jgi:hypothetical protein